MTGRAVILDRDGVITPKLPMDEYILRDDQVKLAEGAAEGLRILASAGFRLFIFSNQKCVAKGLITLSEAERLQALVIALVESEGVRIEGARLCPHCDEDGCACRKPKPGMILDLAATYGFDLASTIVIGDSQRDIDAGVSAGCDARRLIDGKTHGTLLDVARSITDT